MKFVNTCKVRKEDSDKIKSVRDQIKIAVREQKWSVKREGKYDNEKSYVYLNSLEESDTNASIKIEVRPDCKYNSNDPKVIISIKNDMRWKEYNAMHYGFRKFELRILRCVLYFTAISKEHLKQELRKQIFIEDLAKSSDVWIKENKQIFRDSKLDEILDKK